ADHGESGPGRAQAPNYVDLDLVDVLVLVDQDVIPAAGDHRAEGGIGEQRPPGEQQVVEVEQRGGPFAGHIGAEQVEDLFRVPVAPRELRGEHLAGRAAGIDRPGVGVDERVRAWE